MPRRRNQTRRANPDYDYQHPPPAHARYEVVDERYDPDGSQEYTWGDLLDLMRHHDEDPASLYIAMNGHVMRVEGGGPVLLAVPWGPVRFKQRRRRRNPTATEWFISVQGRAKVRGSWTEQRSYYLTGSLAQAKQRAREEADDLAGDSREDGSWEYRALVFDLDSGADRPSATVRSSKRRIAERDLRYRRSVLARDMKWAELAALDKRHRKRGSSGYGKAAKPRKKNPHGGGRRAENLSARRAADAAFAALAAASRYALPAAGGRLRKDWDAGEFMYMGLTPAGDGYAMKHRGTRNYLYVYPGGLLVVPAGDGPHFGGVF